MRALAGLLCGLLGLVPGAAAYEPDVFGTAGQVAGQAALGGGGGVVGLAGALGRGAAPGRRVGGGGGKQAEQGAAPGG
ncbi:hypothetical protein CKA48_32370, partial [Pseudomonas aeruginosa]